MESAAKRVDGRWSVAEIVEHLDRTYSGTVKGFDRCLQRRRVSCLGADVEVAASHLHGRHTGIFPHRHRGPGSRGSNRASCRWRK